MTTKEKAAGRAATTAKASLTDRFYPPPRPQSTSHPKIPPRPANRRAKTHTPLRLTWRDRAALGMLGLAGNLQGARHLTAMERAAGWDVFAGLLRRFVASGAKGTQTGAA